MNSMKPIQLYPKAKTALEKLGFELAYNIDTKDAYKKLDKGNGRFKYNGTDINLPAKFEYVFAAPYK